jgi:glycosyltransferase involved in cell wall biosynthesis
MPFVSVIIPTYNNGCYIREALDSVLAQSFTDYEVIVVDDGSTDNTCDVLAPYRSAIHYHYQANLGLAVARNVGLHLAAGDYVTYLDADDVWERDNLHVKAEVLRADPALGGVFSEFTIFTEDGRTYSDGMRRMFPMLDHTQRSTADLFAERRSVALPDGREYPVYRGHVFDNLFQGNFILPTSMVFSRAAALQVGQFRPDMRTQQDYEYWLRFSQHFSLACVDHQLVRYRRHSHQLTNPRRIEYVLLAVHSIIDRYEEHFASRGRQREYARRKASLLTQLGIVYVCEGRHADARARLGESIRRDPAYLQAYGGLALSVVPHRLFTLMRNAGRGLRTQARRVTGSPEGRTQ